MVYKMMLANGDRIYIRSSFLCQLETPTIQSIQSRSLNIQVEINLVCQMCSNKEVKL